MIPEGSITIGLFSDGVEPLDARYNRVTVPLTEHELVTRVRHYGWLWLRSDVTHQARAVTAWDAHFGPFNSTFEVDAFGIWLGELGPIMLPQGTFLMTPGEGLTIGAGWEVRVS